MGINFPPSPSVGTLHPDPATVGLPQYKWDGTAWVAVSTPEALSYVKRTGDTMTGHLSLPLGPAASNAVRKDYVDNQLEGRAPLDALAYSGMQINGDMSIDEATAHQWQLSNIKYFCDGWMQSWGGTGLAIQTVAIAVPVGPFKWTSQTIPQTAKAVLAAGDYAVIYQPIEGCRIERLGWGTAAASPITIGFWSKHTRDGLFSGAVRNGALNRSYVFSYTQVAADVAQFNLAIIPGDTSGTWAVDNTIGMVVSFAIASGNTLLAPSIGTWLAGNYIAATGQQNCVSAVSDVTRFTGVFVLPGSYGPTAAQSPRLMRSYDQELQICRRYLQAPRGAAYTAYSPTTGIVRAGVLFSPQMRAGPTVVPVNGTLISGNSATVNFTATGLTVFSAAGGDGVVINITPSVAVDGLGQGCTVVFAPGSALFDARL